MSAGQWLPIRGAITGEIALIFTFTGSGVILVSTGVSVQSLGHGGLMIMALGHASET